MPSTLRTELDRLGYDWDGGQMIQQDGTAYQQPKNGRVVEKEDPLLNARFANGPTCFDMPRFMAADANAVYIPYRDNQQSGLRKIYHEPAEYLERGDAIPYPEV